jgi:hypothetical protein
MAAFGEEMIARLESAGFPLSVALWLKEDDEWTLLLGSPEYDRLGPHGAYLRLIRALYGTGPAPLNSLPLTLEGHRNPLIKALRSMFRKTKPVQGMRLGGQNIGGTWVEDAYVYRIK